jgi:hypothetical protein
MAAVVAEERTPARLPCRQHHGAGEVRVFVHQRAARLGNNPHCAEQERHAEADQLRRQFLEIAIRQIRDDPRESLERRQPADIALLDVGKRGFA